MTTVIQEDSAVLTNWHQRALYVEVSGLNALQLAQINTPCPWCDEKFFSLMDRKRPGILIGRTVCGKCGQFFRFELDGQRSEGRTFRIRLAGVRFDGQPVAFTDAPHFGKESEDGEGLQGQDGHDGNRA